MLTIDSLQELLDAAETKITDIQIEASTIDRMTDDHYDNLVMELYKYRTVRDALMQALDALVGL